MTSNKKTWFLDQLTKSSFFHRKLHEWQLLETAEAIEQFPGESLEWDLPTLCISEAAWKKVIHRGIKPVTVFAHPNVLMRIPRATAYYRMLSMVSQKSMKQIGLPVEQYELGSSLPEASIAQDIACRLNQIISQLIESDVKVNAREFDLWRGMAAGTQAQGAWQNAKGEEAENLVKNLIRQRLQEQKLIAEEHAEKAQMTLSDGRKVIFGSEPDIAFYKEGQIQAAVEIKGGIDPAGVFERLGAALKSLSRVRTENSIAVTILIISSFSLTEQAKKYLQSNCQFVTHWFTLEGILTDETIRAKFFALLGI